MLNFLYIFRFLRLTKKIKMMPLDFHSSLKNSRQISFRSDFSFCSHSVSSSNTSTADSSFLPFALFCAILAPSITSLKDLFLFLLLRGFQKSEQHFELPCFLSMQALMNRLRKARELNPGLRFWPLADLSVRKSA